MKSITNTASGLSLLVIGAASIALASSPPIGMASATGGLTLDNSKVSGNATLFDGSTVQTSGYSRIQLKNGTRMDLAAGSKARVFADHAALESGMSEIQGGSHFEISARTLKIRPSNSESIARVKMNGDRGVLVTALNAPVEVLNKEGLLVARVTPGLPLSFLPQAAAAGAFDNTGCVLQKSGSAVFVDETGNQIFELRGADLRRAIGNMVHVTGTTDTAATPAGGASQVINVANATITRRGGCSALASKVGATTTAAGLGAAAGAGAGAAVAGGAAAGGAAAGGAAAAGAAAAAAGVGTTAVVVGGVAAATAAAIGGAAAAGAIGSASPQAQ